MKYYIIAGEASGDLHGSNLMKALKEKDQSADFRVWGGDLMEAQGGELVKHYRDIDFMGFVEVVANLRTILGNLSDCKNDIQSYQPDTLILIDYPGFNLRIAKWAKTRGLRVIYYISPQVWAWNVKRVHKIKKIVDQMLVILPFEKAFYKQFDYDVEFVGHPLLDEINKRQPNPAFYNQHHLDVSKKIIALLPGSRSQEIKSLFTTMLGLVNQFKDYQFVLAGAPAISMDFYEKIILDFENKNNQKINLTIVKNQTYNLLDNAHAAIVASGTATLETGLFSVPQVVCYKGSQISYHIAKRLIRVKYISLVNLIMDKLVVKELIQGEFTLENLKLEFEKILQTKERSKMLENYKNLKTQLGDGGASRRAATIVYNFLAKNEKSQKI